MQPLSSSWRIVGLITVILMCWSAAQANWTFSTPTQGQSFGNTTTIACTGTADAISIIFAVELKYKSSETVRSTASGTSTDQSQWSGNLVPPEVGIPPVHQWSTNANDIPAIITLKPVGGTNVTTNVNFTN